MKTRTVLYAIAFAAVVVCEALLIRHAAAQAIVPNAETQFLDVNGKPLGGGSVFFYIPGTTTLKATFSDPLATVPNTNPVQLDAGGRAKIWGTGSYREVVWGAFGNLVWDQVTSVGGTSGVQTTIVASGPVALCAGVVPIKNGTGAAIALQMPSAPSAGQTCTFVDAGNNAGLWPITFFFAPNSLTNGQSNWTMNVSSSAITFTWLGTPAMWAVQ